MFILFSISGGLELWSVHHTWIYKSSELKVSYNIGLLSKILNNSKKYLLGTNVFKTLESYW